MKPLHRVNGLIPSVQLLINLELDCITVWTVDFETPVCKLYLLFVSADAAQEKEKREEIAAAHWCFKVCSPYSITDEKKMLLNYSQLSSYLAFAEAEPSPSFELSFSGSYHHYKTGQKDNGPVEVGQRNDTGVPHAEHFTADVSTR